MQCEKESEITRIQERQIAMSANLIKLDHAINGNGNKGLKTDVVELKLLLENFSNDVKSLRTAVSGLTKFQIETQNEIRLNTQRKVNNRWLIATSITLVSILIAILAM